jgi:hypothetical protein
MPKKDSLKKGIWLQITEPTLQMGRLKRSKGR